MPALESIEFSFVVRQPLSALKELYAQQTKGEQNAQSFQSSLKRIEDFLVSASDKAIKSTLKHVEALEKQNAAMQRTPLERINAQRELEIRNIQKSTLALQDQERAIQRVNKLFDERVRLSSKHEDGGGFAKYGEGLKSFIEAPAQTAQGALTGLLEKMGTTGAVAAAAVIGFSALAAAGYELVKSAGEETRQLDNLSKTIGLSLEETEKLSIAAKLVGVDIGTLAASSRTLANALADPTGAGRKASEALHTLHISTLQYNGDMKEEGEVLLEVLNKLSQIPNVAERVHESQLLLGKGAKVLQPLIEDFPALKKAADELAASLKAGTNEELLKADKSIREMQASWELFKKALAAAIAPIVIPVSYSITNSLQGKGPEWAVPGAVSVQSTQPDEAIANASKRFLPSVPPHFYKDAEASISKGDALGKQIQAQYDRTKEGLEKQIDLQKQAAEKAREAATQTGASYEFKIQKQKEMNEALAKEAAARRQIQALEHGDKASENFPDALSRLDTMKNFREMQIAHQHEMRNLTNPSQRQEYTERYGRRSMELLQQHNAEEGKKQAQKDAEEALRAWDSGQRISESSFEQFKREQEHPTTDLGVMMSRLPTNLPGPPSASYEQRLRALQQSERIQEKIVHLTETNEVAATEKIFSLRKDVAEKEHAIALEKASSLANEMDRARAIYDVDFEQEQKLADLRAQNQEKLLERERKQFDEIKSSTQGLLHTLFTNPQSFNKQLETTVRDAALKPVEDKLSTVIAGQLQKHLGIHSTKKLSDLNVGTQGDALKVYVTNGERQQSGGASSGSGGGWWGAGGVNALPSFTIDLGGSNQLPMTQAASIGNVLTMPLPNVPSASGSSGSGGGLFGRVINGGLQKGSGSTASQFNPKGIISNIKNTDWGLTSTTDSEGNEVGAFRHGVAGAAIMAGGTMLGERGLLGNSRGTWGGIAQGTAGGAMIGFEYGGPMGAAIGAGVGFGIGMGEKLAGVESPQNEAKRLVKQQYHVNIDNSMAGQIVQIAQQKYAGHVSIAVRDPDVRKMLELYAAGTGQKMPASASAPHAGSLVEQGGRLYQAPTYQYGQAYSYQSSLPVAGGMPTSTWPSPGGPTYLSVNVSGQGLAPFMTGQFVTTDFVQRQVSNAYGSSNNRVGTSAMLTNAGLITG